MGRTSDQAKLLFLGLLRTVSALASTEHKVYPFSSSQALVVASAAASNAASAASFPSSSGFSQHQQHPSSQHYINNSNQQQHIPTQHQASKSSLPQAPPLPELTLRLAHRTDVPSIQRCNLASLPENYNQQFYTNHLRQWPELAIVVECASENRCSESEAGGRADPRQPTRMMLKPDSHYSFSPFPTGRAESKIVAYVIGKVEEHIDEQPINDAEEEVDAYHDRYAKSLRQWGSAAAASSPPGFRQQQQHHQKRRNVFPSFSSSRSFRAEKLGHVTSLAVTEPFRRRGLAQTLMEQLHYHMATYYGVENVGLHVRADTNEPAVKLYSSFGYRASERIPAYYQDGEDAFLMKKRLEKEIAIAQNSIPNNRNVMHNQLFFGNLRRNSRQSSNASGDPSLDFHLPRTVGRRPPESTATATMYAPNEEIEEESNTSSELLTGTM